MNQEPLTAQLNVWIWAPEWHNRKNVHSLIRSSHVQIPVMPAPSISREYKIGLYSEEGKSGILLLTCQLQWL